MLLPLLATYAFATALSAVLRTSAACDISRLSPSADILTLCIITMPAGEISDFPAHIMTDAAEHA